MQITEEMKEMMKRTMEEFFTAYWKEHATPEQEAKRETEGKTFKGAANFVESVARTMRHGRGVVAMPDELAYLLLFDYMENCEEGYLYKTPEEVEREAKLDKQHEDAAKAAGERAAAKKARENSKRVAKKIEAAQLTLF